MAVAVGIVVTVKKRPSVSVAVLEGTPAAATVRETFDMTTDSHDIESQVHDLGSNLRNRLRGIKADKVIIRRADRPPRASNQEGPRTRLLVEGGMILAAMDVVKDTSALNGRDAAALCGTTKANLDAEGVVLAGDDYGSAAAVALIGLR